MRASQVLKSSVASQADLFESMVERIRALAPEVASRADEIETGRRIPPDLIERLRDIGVFRSCAPASHGGLELPYPQTLELLREVAALDGSLGWVSMLGVGHMPHLALLPRETFNRIYADGPDIIVAGSAAPAGTAEIVEGGYRVTGRWPFASGCQHADWLFAGFVVTRNGEPVPRSPGSPMPLTGHAALPASAWEIEDTWKVMGLKGTGSNHIRLNDVFVPHAQVFGYKDKSCLPGPLYGSALHLIPPLHCSPAIGIAEAAVSHLIELANTGKKQLLMTEAMRDSVIFQTELGQLNARLRAARATARTQADELWEQALNGGLHLSNTSLLADCFQTSTWVTNECVDIVERCYRLGGGSALYSSSPLQRYLRDVHGASQHAAVQPMAYTRTGAMLLGHKVAHPVAD
ncbi:acyl-CoA dehydrogenase family protein [Paraburkholderia sp. J67]|uniref:acyl-CoA dehydrogenase family protein n=1 Tax=Paraburkholderia sp. J67 TaxID=2805435 RepID=UPI002ABD205B|nr:acyl-CoA dehydrogenase family protein [Paraburkholderia sp. J67]